MRLPSRPFFLIVPAFALLFTTACSKEPSEHPLASTPRSDAPNQTTTPALTQAPPNTTTPSAQDVPAQTGLAVTPAGAPNGAVATSSPTVSNSQSELATLIPGLPGPIENAAWATSMTRLDMVTGPVPISWQQVSQTSSGMEKIAFNILAPDGGIPARLSVFSFPEAAGNTVEANIRRWRSQFRTQDGAPAEPSRLTIKTTGGLATTIVSLEGSYTGMGSSTAKPQQMMLVAITKTPSGTEFIRLLGPKKAVSSAAAQYRWLIQNLALVPSNSSISNTTN